MSTTNRSLAHTTRAAASPSVQQEFWGGFKAVLPMMLGAIPFGLIYGVLAVAGGLSPVMAQAMSMLIFAGSAQFITAQLVAAGAPSPVIIFTIAIVNLRHVLYSASISPYLQHLRPVWKWGLAYLLTDEAYAVVITRYHRADDQETSHRHWYLLGAGLGLWVCWQSSTAVGVFLGAQIPAYWSLDFAIALTFIAIVVPALKDRPNLVAALGAGVIAVAAGGLPYKLGLVVATLIGIVAGVGADRHE
jgi:4-azaleucine resistance transporter AzlC